MLRCIAISKLVAQGCTREEAKVLLSAITEKADLKRIYSIRLDHNMPTVKVEATLLPPEELFKEAFINMISIYMLDHKEEYSQNPAKAAQTLREKVDLLEIEACREAFLED